MIVLVVVHVCMESMNRTTLDYIILEYIIMTIGFVNLLIRLSCLMIFFVS